MYKFMALILVVLLSACAAKSVGEGYSNNDMARLKDLIEKIHHQDGITKRWTSFDVNDRRFTNKDLVDFAATHIACFEREKMKYVDHGVKLRVAGEVTRRYYLISIHELLKKTQEMFDLNYRISLDDIRSIYRNDLFREIYVPQQANADAGLTPGMVIKEIKHLNFDTIAVYSGADEFGNQSAKCSFVFKENIDSGRKTWKLIKFNFVE